jgi:hypothetical protein
MLRRHAPDAVSLVFGTLFAGSTVIWLLSATDVIDYNGAWLAGPAILIVAGVVGLAVALRPGRSAPPEALWTAGPPTTDRTESVADPSDAPADDTDELRDRPTSNHD